MTHDSDSYIIITCDDGAIPRFNRLQLRTEPPTFIELQPGENKLSVKGFPDLKYGFRQIEDWLLKDDDYEQLANGYVAEYNCEAVNSIDLSHFDHSEVTQMNNMFERMTFLRQINFGTIKFENITSIEYAFNWIGQNNGDFLDLSRIDFSQIHDTTEMLYGCFFETVNLTGCDMSNVEHACDMFNNCGIKKLILDDAKLSKEVVDAIISEVREWASLEEVSLIGCEPHIVQTIIMGLTVDWIESWGSIKFSIENLLDFKPMEHPEKKEVFVLYNHALMRSERLMLNQHKQSLFDDEIFRYLSNSPAMRNYPVSCRRIQNPFKGSTGLYNMFQGWSLEHLIGLKPIEDVVRAFTPTLPLGALISQLEQIQNTIAMEYGQNPEMKLANLREAVEKVEIFLVTTADETKEHTVHGLFKDGEKTKQKVPISKSLSENGFDALGMYISDTGSIYLWVDKIYRYRNYPLLFQSVLLHELIHLFFDVIRKGLNSSPSNSGSNTEWINEETIDNCLMLHCYAQACSPFIGGVEYAYKEVRDFVNLQPSNYQKGGIMFDKTQTWIEMRIKLINFLKQPK